MTEFYFLGEESL